MNSARTAKREFWPLLFLLAAAIAFFWQSTIGGKVLLPLDNLYQWQPWASLAPAGFSSPHNQLIGDSILENYGWKKFLLDSIHNHQLPLWNPNILGGTPFFAPGQASVLYPFTLLWLILPLAAAYGWFAALHLFLAGAFSYAYLRVCGTSRTAGLIGGLAFMFSGRLVTSILWPQMIGAMIYLPLLLLLLELIVLQAPRRWPILPALGTALVLGVSILAGHIEASVYVMAAMGLYVAGRVFFVILSEAKNPSLAVRMLRSTLSMTKRAVACSLGAVILGVGVAAVQLLPFYEVGSRNFRSGGVTYQDVVGFALKLPQLFTFVLPDFYGNPIIHWAPYWGPKDYVEQAAYIGVVPLLLALSTPLLIRKQPRVAALWLVIVVSLLFAFGTPIYRLIFFDLPGFNQIHSPFRWLIPYTGAMALLAGFGFDFALERLGRARLASGAVALLALAGLAVWAKVILKHVPAPEHALEMRNYAVLLVILVAAALIVWAPRRLLKLLAVGLVAGDLAFFGVGFNTAADPSILQKTPPAIAFLQQDHSLFRVTAYGQQKTFEANGNTLYGLQDARGYDSVILGRYAQLSGLIEPQDQLIYNRIKPIDQPQALDSPLLNLLNVKYIITQQPLADPNWRQVYSGPDGRVYQNQHVLPRAFVVGAVEVGDQLNALKAINPATTALVDAPVNLASGVDGPASITSYSGRKVSIQASGPGLLVLTDNNFPGWKATVDGQPAQLVTADYTFRGVPLPAGQHTVEFSFAPQAFIAGGLISGLSLAFILLLAVAYAWQRMPAVEGHAARRVTKNSLTPLASNVGSKLLSFGFSVYYFRALGLDQVSKYVFAIAVWLFMDTIIGFGLQQLVGRDVAREKQRTNAYLTNALVVRLGMTVIIGLPVALGVLGAAHFAGFDRQTALVIAILIAGFVPGAFANVFSHVFAAHELMEYQAFAQVLIAIVNIGLGVAFILAGWGIVGLALASLISNAVNAVLFWALLGRAVGRPRLELEPRLVAGIIRGAFPIMLNQLLVVFFFKIDVLILEAFRASREVGLYGAAYKFVDAMLIVPANFVPAVFPILSRQAAGQREVLKRGYELSLKVLLLIAFPVLAGFEVFAGDIIGGFYGQEYAPAAVALRILMLYLPFSYVNGLTQYVLIALDKQKTIVRFFAITAVFNAVVNLALIPRFGFLAASAVTAASEVVLLGPLLWLTIREVGSTSLGIVLRPLAGAALAGLTMLALRGPAIAHIGALAGPAVAALAGAVVYLAALLALRAFSEEELAIVRALFKRAEPLHATAA